MSNRKFKTLDGFNSTGDVVVGANTLTVDTSNERVGIKKGDPQHPLDINGTVAATLFSGSGASLTNVNAATLAGTANYLRSDVATTYTGSGNFTFNSTGTLRLQAGELRLDNNRFLRFGTVNTPGVSMRFNSANNTMIVEGSNTTFISNGGTFFQSASNAQRIRIQGNSTTNANTMTITTANLTENRTITIPNATGTVALISDLPAVGNGKLTVTGSNGLSGTGEFTANQGTDTGITLTNSDRGSSQNIFKRIGNAGGTQQFVAGNNNDMLRFAASGAASVSFNNADKTVTYNSTDTTYNLISQAEIQTTGNTNERLISGQRFQEGLNTDRLVTGSWTFRAASNSQRIRIQGNSTTNANTMTITTANLNTNRTITLPNASGTVALTSDIPSVPPTNLSTTATATTRNVNSSTGTNVTLPAANTTQAGVMTVADRNKLDGMAANAQIGTVTSVGSGNGLTGGPIVTSGTLAVGAGNGISVSNTAVAVNAGTGLIANSTGVHVGAGHGISANSTAVAVDAGDGIVANSTGTHVDSSVVRTSGNQDIAGTKTFVFQPTVPSLLLGIQSNKATISYTANAARTYTLPNVGTNADFVMNSGNQDIAGTKTFVQQPTVPSLLLGTQPNKATISYTANAAFTYTIPNPDQNANFVMDAGNTSIGGTKTFTQQPTVPSLLLGSQPNKAAIIYTTNTARTFTLPNVGGNRTFAFINQAQTFEGTQTFSSTISGSINGNAATATILANTRQINGVNFNGSTNITVPGNFTNRTTNESGHLAFIGTTATGNRQMHTNANIRVNPGTGVITANDVVASSDEKYKENIASLDTSECLKTILSLRPTSYDWKESGEFDTGLIAQEVEKVIPHRVVKSGDDSLAVSYGKLVTELIGAVQAQNETINELKKEIEQLKSA